MTDKHGNKIKLHNIVKIVNKIPPNILTILCTLISIYIAVLASNLTNNFNESLQRESNIELTQSRVEMINILREVRFISVENNIILNNINENRNINNELHE